MIAQLNLVTSVLAAGVAAAGLLVAPGAVVTATPRDPTCLQAGGVDTCRSPDFVDFHPGLSVGSDAFRHRS